MSSFKLRERQREVIVDMFRCVTQQQQQQQQQGVGPMMPTTSSMRGATTTTAALNGGGPSSGSGNACWKVLIYDAVGRDIVAPLMKVKDLRELGVTLHLSIDAPREAIPGVPAVYLCAPTSHNISIIGRDCVNSTYQQVYVNFVAQTPRPQLEALAESLVSLNAIEHIRVTDRTLSYVALANDLFSLMHPRAFLHYSSSRVTEAEMEMNFSHDIVGLSHVLLTLQQTPIIAYTTGGAAQEMCSRLTTSIADLVRANMFSPSGGGGAVGGGAPSSGGSSGGGQQRPLLLLVDRNFDMSAPLHHPFTYRGLLVDALGMDLNKVDLAPSQQSDDPSSSPQQQHQQPHQQRRSYEIDPEHDAFYARNAGLDFSIIAQNVDTAMAEYKAEYAAIMGTTTAATTNDGASGGGGGGGLDDPNSNVSKMLASAPHIAEKKRSLEAHTVLAYQVLSLIKQHALDALHGVEQASLHHEGFEAEDFQKLMDNPNCPLADKQRLYLLTYLCALEDSDSSASAAVIAQLEEQHLDAVGGRGGLPALDYLKRLRQWTMGGGGGGGGAGQQQQQAASRWAFAQNLARNIAKSLKATRHNMLPLTRLVDVITGGGPDTGGGSGGASGGSGGAGGGGGSSGDSAANARLLDSVCAKDPKTKQSVDVTAVRFSHVIVFVCGGGCIAEYDDLKDWEANVAKGGKKVLYGASEMLTGGRFLEQLTALGQE